MAPLIHLRGLAALCAFTGAGVFVRADTPLASIPATPLAVPSQPSTAQESRIKAAYLVKFTQYTTWPAKAFESDSSPLVIGVIEPNSLTINLNEETRTVTKPRRIEIRAVSTPEEAARCHAVFFNQSDSRLEESWLQILRNKPVLTVSETDLAIEHGATIRLVLDNKKIRFDVSLSAMELTELKINTDMLRHARTVHNLPKASN